MSKIKFYEALICEYVMDADGGKRFDRHVRKTVGRKSAIHDVQ